MDPIDKHHIYSLLCAVILADKRVLDVELATFVDVATGIQVALGERNIDEPETLRTWFDFNFIRISNCLLEPNWQRGICEHLNPLKHIGYKWHVIQAMRAIAIADHEFHKSEINVIKLAIETWNEDQADYLTLESQGNFSKRTILEPSSSDISASSRPDDGM